ncbi:hypothetical protein [Parasphingopyxis sp.]|uniref:hypothetical protein n=1 Tax=Parasphingopyxis sp. TaxID=1920299 RepID=UPI002629A361|nr:hypothetical protein [Parasphingopyxis sp.]
MSGPYDVLDRIAQLVVMLVALFAFANGAFMLLAPMDWYYAVPTVPATGPANTHFIADIGIAYLSSGAMLFYAAMNLKLRWMAALAGTVWLLAHGVLHIYELIVGICSPDRFLQDAPGVLGPPLLVLLAVGTMIGRQRVSPAGIPAWLFIKAAGQKMEKSEAQYLRKLVAAPGRAFEKFTHFMPASMHRHAASAEMLHVARIGATLAEDCGPCALTAAQWALVEHVPRDVANAALAGGEALNEDERLAFRFGEAIATQSPEAFALGDAIEEKFGDTVRFELAMAAALVRSYPAMKRGLGLTKACSAVQLAV